MESREAVCSSCYQQYDTSQTQRCPSCGHPAPEDRESPSALVDAGSVAVTRSASAIRWKHEVLNPSTLPAHAMEAAVGIVGIFTWYWVYALSHAISARLLLAVDKASE
jgi:hypothetical protein